MYNAFNDELREAYGIVTSQFEFLRFIRDHDGARVADLANEFAIGVGATSKAVDRLQSKSLIIRRASPGDRRAVLLKLSKTGNALINKAETFLQHRMYTILFEAASEKDIAAAAGCLAELRFYLEKNNIGLPTG